MIKLLVQGPKSQLALSRRHVLKVLQAAESLVVRVLETAILHLEKLDHLCVSVEAVDSLLVLDEVLNAA